MSKHLVAIVLSTCLAVGLAGCSSEEPTRGARQSRDTRSHRPEEKGARSDRTAESSTQGERWAERRQRALDRELDEPLNVHNDSDRTEIVEDSTDESDELTPDEEIDGES